MNPNKNKHFNDEALRINRTLKKKLDKVDEIADDLLKLIKQLKEDIKWKFIM